MDYETSPNLQDSKGMAQLKKVIKGLKKNYLSKGYTADEFVNMACSRLLNIHQPTVNWQNLKNTSDYYKAKSLGNFDQRTLELALILKQELKVLKNKKRNNELNEQNNLSPTCPPSGIQHGGYNYDEFSDLFMYRLDKNTYWDRNSSSNSSDNASDIDSNLNYKLNPFIAYEEKSYFQQNAPATLSNVNSNPHTKQHINNNVSQQNNNIQTNTQNNMPKGLKRKNGKKRLKEPFDEVKKRFVREANPVIKNYEEDHKLYTEEAQGKSLSLFTAKDVHTNAFFQSMPEGTQNQSQLFASNNNCLKGINKKKIQKEIHKLCGTRRKRPEGLDNIDREELKLLKLLEEVSNDSTNELKPTTHII